MDVAIQVEARPLGALTPNPRNARTHSRKQIRQIERSIEAFGFTNPLLVDETGMLIAGHGRLEAARSLEMATVPVIVLPGLSAAQKRQLMLADNKIAGNAGWDRETLAIELGELTLEGGDITLTGFAPAEIDQLLLDHEADATDPADDLPEPSSGPPVSRYGDLWLLGKHRLLCGDARSREDVEKLCDGARPAMAFLDPPYNVRVAGHAAKASRDGAVHFACMDWRHIEALMATGRKVYGQTLNLVVWAKTTAGQGSFYRSQHELIGVFRVGDAAHLNNVELGRHDRSRSNVWSYAGANTFRNGRLEDLDAHPTVKPVAMIADAIKDCTRRGDAVLDVFGGSGSTLLACERVGRRALMLEYEPRFVDVAIRRWQAFTGKDAVHAESGRVFDESAADTESAA